MKKQLIALGLASLLTAPSVVLAEAEWYGSFRAMIHSQGGHTTMGSNGSRWGVKGTSEVSEGLSAVYRYEESLDLATATLGAGNRLSYAGLSGGFGSITAGRIWSASYNHVGGVTDNGRWSGNSGLATVRISNAVSYAASTGPVSFQVDVQMDPKGEVLNESVDMAQFGVTVDTGFAAVGFAGMNKALGDGKSEKKMGTKTLSAIAVKAPVAGFMLSVGGYQEKIKRDGEKNLKNEQTQFSATGPVADTGLSFGLNVADIGKGDKSNVASGTNPWNIHVVKDLGGGASVAFEYIDYDHNKKHEDAVKSESVVELRVGF